VNFYYIERERADAVAPDGTGLLPPGVSAYEYAFRPRIVDGLPAAELWLPHAAAVLRAGEEGLAFSPEDATDWATMFGCGTTLFALLPPEEAPPPKGARARVEEHAASNSREWRERFGLATEADRAEAATADAAVAVAAEPEAAAGRVTP